MVRLIGGWNVISYGKQSKIIHVKVNTQEKHLLVWLLTPVERACCQYANAQLKPRELSPISRNSLRARVSWNSPHCTWDGSIHPFLLHLSVLRLSLPFGSRALPLQSETLKTLRTFLRFILGKHALICFLPWKTFSFFCCGLGAPGRQSWGHGQVI